jgi:DMSO/TMAO reductase YedYZ molybdopterin-dependent catalytic subunit
LERLMSSRRVFLKEALFAATAGLTANSRLTWAIDQKGASDSGPFVHGKAGMIIRSLRFLDLEMPPEFADVWITPVQHFYVRNHMFEPAKIDVASWNLSIGGKVEKPLALKLYDLGAFDQHSIINTLECAGNGRAFHDPKVPGIQWQRGAVGNARFSGPRLADLLQRAGVKPTGKHVMFRGLDEVPGKVPTFVRSIPIEKASDPATLVATHMNGVALTQHHGFPARALVPGWVGAASCKWLAEIQVLEKEFEGNFMKPGYRYPNQPVLPGTAVNPDDTHPLTALSVKSMIASPTDDSKRKVGPVPIHGVAWAGEADIVRVEVSTDAGATWKPAELGKEHERYAWRLWSFPWKPSKSDHYVILSRATDSQGRTQPDTAAWNPSGYLFNAVDRVNVYVEG